MNEKNDLLHTPDGVRDIYGAELALRLKTQECLLQELRAGGFEDIKPPTFEFFDVFARKISGTRARDLYKFFDKDGNTLVLRSDFTPQVARCISKYFLDTPDAGSIRLCYQGDVFVNVSDLQGKLRQTTQAGAELAGDGSVNADAEMIALLIRCLIRAGLSDFQVSIGHADFFHGISTESALTPEEEDEIRLLIAEHNYFAAEKRMFDLRVDETYREILLKISDFVGDAGELATVRKSVTNDISRAAIDRLCAVYDALQKEDLSRYVSFDPGMLSATGYYTGVTFEAYTYGVGDAIAKGGRYDRLLSYFGKDAPAIGFAITVDDLVNALSRQEEAR